MMCDVCDVYQVRSGQDSLTDPLLLLLVVCMPSLLGSTWIRLIPEEWGLVGLTRPWERGRAVTVIVQLQQL